MEISDYIFFSLIGFTVIVTFGVSCYGIYCWWKAKKSEPRSCYVAIADETSPLLANCADPCVFGCAVCKNNTTSPPMFSPAYRTPGGKYPNKVLVTSSGFPVTTSLVKTRSSPRPRFGSSSSAKRSSKSSLKKFILIRDYTPETYNNESQATGASRPSSDLKRMSETASAAASSISGAKTTNTGIHSNHHSQTIQAEVHPSNNSDYSCSTMAPVVMDFDEIRVLEQTGTLSYSPKTADVYSSEQSKPGTLEVTECIMTETITPVRYKTPSYPSHASRVLSSSSDYARSSSADNSWESSSSITCALASSSSPSDENGVSLSPIRKGSIQYVVRDGKGFFTSDTNVFSSVPL